MGQRYYENYSAPWWNVKQWSKKAWLIAGGVLTVILVVAITVGVVVSRNNAYPAYSKLTYQLSDTSNGFVHYVPETQATSLNLTSASNSAAVVRVDTSVGNTSSPDASTGRYSVRLTSKTQYNGGLFIFDIKHTPLGCGTWPALWLSDPDNWPDHGEIDIMEAVNLATEGNAVTLHTTGGCTMQSVKRKMTGTAAQADCHNTTNSNAGCGVDGSTSTYGSAFNSAGGGIVAVEWRSDGIRVWQFVSGSVPSDITAGSPDPSTWGTALADFPDTKCNIGNHFKNASIIANIDLCGDLAGNKYQTSTCPKNCVGSHTCIGGTSPTNCTDYVANNPSAFTDAFWEFGSFKVYQST